MVLMVLWDHRVKEVQGVQWVSQAQRAWRVLQEVLDNQDQRELLAIQEDKESMVQEDQGVIQVLMVLKGKPVPRAYQGFRDAKDCGANQEILVYQVQMDQLEKKEKLDHQALKGHQGHKEIWALRV